MKMQKPKKKEYPDSKSYNEEKLKKILELCDLDLPKAIEEFSEYNVYTTENKADGNIDIVEHDMIHPVDQNSIQEKILKLIMGQK